jgi:hypothetical protein
VKEDKMDRACCMCGTEEEYIQSFRRIVGWNEPVRKLRLRQEVNVKMDLKVMEWR